MQLIILFAVISSAVDALSQLRITPVDSQEKKYVTRSWLPNFIFKWDFKSIPVIGGVLDAFHQFQGWGLFLYGYSCSIFFGRYYMELLSWFPINSTFRFFVYSVAFMAVYTLAWYQIRNLFLHIIWIYPKYWKEFRFFKG